MCFFCKRSKHVLWKTESLSALERLLQNQLAFFTQAADSSFCNWLGDGLKMQKTKSSWILLLNCCSMIWSILEQPAKSLRSLAEETPFAVSSSVKSLSGVVLLQSVLIFLRHTSLLLFFKGILFFFGRLLVCSWILQICCHANWSHEPVSYCCDVTSCGQ